MSDQLTGVIQPLMQIQDISRGGGPVAESWQLHLEAWRGKPPPTRRAAFVESDFSLAARDARRFELKAHFATIAMHLSEPWRQSLFKQLDLLLDTGEDWENEHALPTLDSWKTFVRLQIYHPFRRTPRLGLFEGIVSGTWMHEDVRITLESLPNDRIRWIASKDTPEGRDAAAGETTLKRLIPYLSPFDSANWLFDGKD